MSGAVAERTLPAPGRPKWVVISAIGAGQVLAWGSSYYLPAVLVAPIVRATDWPAAWVVGGLSLGLLVSGLVSPRVGRTIDRFGGRPVLTASAFLLCLGLLGLGLAPDLPAYVAAWAVIGLGMGCGLYDPAFAALGRAYGEKARPLITGVTLWGGFASTACWPLTAFLESHLGWRGACFAYAAIHLAVTAPLYWFGVPRESARHAAAKRTMTAAAGARHAGRTAFWMVALALTLTAVLTTIVSVEMLAILESGGMPLASAVALGALIGPSQVGARILEFAFARRHHPIWSMIVATALVAVGLALLLFGPALAALGLVLYGAGGGIRSIARGTLPLAIFGPGEYATLMGRIAMPSLITQAISPTLGALLLDRLGPHGAVYVLLTLALLNLLPVLALLPLVRSPLSERAGS